jgi:hypothetical protein
LVLLLAPGVVRAAAALLSVCALSTFALADSSKLAEKLVTDPVVDGNSSPDFEAFLDRLMRAESGGRDLAANPRSTAVGPYQFIKSTFVDVARRHLADKITGLTEEQILALRTDRETARRAAAAYCRESAASLQEKGLSPNYAHLRLAFLLGPTAAARVMQAPAEATVGDLLGPAVVKANPFLVGMTVTDLTAKAARDLAEEPELAPQQHRRSVLARYSARHAEPQASGKTRCKTRLPSCRRFLALRAKSKVKIREANGRPREKAQHRTRG